MQGFGDSPLEIMACQAMLDGRAFLQGFTYSASWQTGTATALGANGTVEIATQINADELQAGPITVKIGEEIDKGQQAIVEAKKKAGFG